MSKEEEEEVGEKVVSVTGGSGYIASWIIKLLLQRGYTVKASVRDLKLLEEGSFDSLVDGCHCVFHTASPVFFSAVDPQAELIEPALKGTLNVLRSCTKSHSIKRVVLTSSTAAIMLSEKAMTSGPEVIIDETWFSDPVFCEESKGWYMLSKTLAEEAAWKFAKEKGIDLVTINPGYVIGPLLQPTLNATVEIILKLINGSSKTFPNLAYRCVDVRDVAMAHVLALEVPSANGRYCLVGHNLHYAQLLYIARKLYPSLPIADKCEDDDKPLVQGPRMSKEKATSLGIEFTPLEVTLRDTIESLKEKSFLNI